MHRYAYNALAQMLQIVPRPTRVLEVGAREINGSARPLFEGLPYLGVDLHAGRGVDLVADGKTLALDEAPDCIVCAETLEHEPEPDVLVHHLAGLLAAGGSLLVTCATRPRAPHSAGDGGALRGGEHYANIARDDLMRWVNEAGLEVCYCIDRMDRGDLYLAARKPCAP